MASDFVIIPTDGNYFAMKGIEKIHYIIGLLRRKLGAEVRILGYFMTKYNAGKKAGRGHQGESDRNIGESVFRRQPYGTTWRWRGAVQCTEHFRLCTLVKRGKGLPESDRGIS